jgi:glycosyltransferase involved in cell wall biosynthesis
VRGGVQAVAASLLQCLAGLDGLEMHLLTISPAGWEGPEVFRRDGILVHLLPSYPRFERLRNYRDYQSIINKMLAAIQPDVIHAQETSADALVALRSGYPTVVTAHGIRREDAKFARSPGQRLRFYFDGVLIERAVIRRARHLIAISRYVTDYFASLLRSDARLYFIPNPVDEQFFRLPAHGQDPVVLFAGRVTPLKRVLDLVQAFSLVIRQVPDAQLRIAGECRTDAAYAETVRRWIHQAGLGEQVHLLGELSQDEILNEYARCRLLALPSAQENAPIVIAQAMAGGKPVVATRVGGVAEMIGQAGERGLLVRVGEIDGMAEGIIRLLREPETGCRMGEGGRAFAREFYQPDQVARRTLAVYQAAAEQKEHQHA